MFDLEVIKARAQAALICMEEVVELDVPLLIAEIEMLRRGYIKVYISDQTNMGMKRERAERAARRSLERLYETPKKD